MKDPYKSEIYEFVKNNNVLGLQKYLNWKIDAQEIDVSKLRETLSTKRIWLNGNHILEDWKFWPQTLETIKFLLEESKDDSAWEWDNGSSTGKRWAEIWTSVGTWVVGGIWEEVNEKSDEPENLNKFNKKVFKVLKRQCKAVVKELGLTIYNYDLNPVIRVDLKAEENYWTYWYKTESINLHNFVDDNWVFDIEWFKEMVIKKNKEYNDALKADYEMRQEEQKFLSTIKWIKYSIEDLYWEKDKWAFYEAFFERFKENNILQFDQYTNFSWGDLVLNFNTKVKGWEWRTQRINKSELKWEDWKYSEEIFKEKLRGIVTKIVEEKFKMYT